MYMPYIGAFSRLPAVKEARRPSLGQAYQQKLVDLVNKVHGSSRVYTDRPVVADNRFRASLNPRNHTTVTVFATVPSS